MDFQLTVFLKETQLQHGLRAEDYARYHRYITNRVATLRQQLSLSNDKKKFLHKEVTAGNAKDPRHLMLLALYAERCWAEAEAMQELVQVKKEARGTDANKPKGGVPPHDQFRKRLNKAVKWAEKLSTVAKAVGTARLGLECVAYEMEVCGRALGAHGKFKEAKERFIKAREAYYQLTQGGKEGSAASEQSQAVFVLKVNELDDRVIFCMQRIGESVDDYNPPRPSSALDTDDGHATSSLQWNGRTLTIGSIKVRDALREARTVGVEALQQKTLEPAGLISVGQANRVLDLMDRRIGYYNDALAHARQGLRAAAEGKDKTEQQLVVHYVLFQVSNETLRRTLFMADVYSRRFRATERVLTSSTGKHAKKAEVGPSQYASPLEVVRLYEAGAEAVAEMEMLPGVSGRRDVEDLAAVCTAGRLLFTGESWRLKGDSTSAEECFRGAVQVLDGVAGDTAVDLRERAERAALQMTASSVLARSPATSAAQDTAAAPLAYLTDADARAVHVAQNATYFPPRYQAVACKPVFVDIAATYVDFPIGDEAGSGGAPAHGAAKSGGAKGAPAESSDDAGKKKKWGWW